jgi:hypothetical protein
MEDEFNLRLIETNEDLVLQNNLCAYCGIKIEDNEIVIRWANNEVKPSKNGVRVFSDYHPFHQNCMKQARIYCPFMRNTQDEEFEIGDYKSLKLNFLKFLKNIDKGV